LISHKHIDRGLRNSESNYNLFPLAYQPRC